MEKRLIKARTQLLLDPRWGGFFGCLSLRLKLQEAKIPAPAATDGEFLYYNEEVISQLPDSIIQLIIAHEVWHCCVGHVFRKQNRELKKWNIAADFSTNISLEELGFSIPKEFLFNKKYKGWSTEKIYEDIPENIELNMPDLIESNKTKLEKKELEQRWKDSIIQAAESMRQRGKLPASIDFLVEKLKPKINWREVLRNFIIMKVKQDYSMLPPSRRHIHNGFYFPSLSGESLGTVVVAIDSSGSVSDKELSQFVSELQSLLDSYPMNLNCFICDCEIQQDKEFRTGETIELKILGRGGTDFRPVFKKIEKNFLNPTCLIYLTDGDGYYPRLTPEYPVLWVLVRDFEVPFGIKIKMED